MEKNTDSWEGFLGSNFLKAEDLVDEEQIFICKQVEYDTENERPMLVLESQGATTKFSLNVTNSVFVENSGLNAPKGLIGKKLKFVKVKAFSPSAKKEVDSLRISSIE